MRTEQVISTLSFFASADLANTNRFLGYDGNYAGNGAAAVGVISLPVSSGEMVPVKVRGFLLVESGAAITVGAKVQSNADGKAIPQAETGITIGYAIDACTGAGSLIRVHI